ncbi:MAG: hypothetical protein ACOYVF_02790 [Candidatus Zixiibacteriota bacterium]
MKRNTQKRKTKSKQTIVDIINDGRLGEFSMSPDNPDIPDEVFEEPSEEALQRYELIPLYYGTEKVATTLQGTIAYDSWAQAGAVSLRDVTEGHVRRLQLKAKQISLEIVAERRRDHWEYIARLYFHGKVTHAFVLKAGTRKVLPFSGGFYYWTSKTVPATIKLLSYKQNVLFDKLSWR